MKQENWQQVRNIFDGALKHAPDERPRFLDKVCANDEELRREVESLLLSLDSAESFMETPAVAKVASVIEAEQKKVETGRCFGHYEIIEQIGAGGMGEVYLAKDKKLDRQVAIKILNERFSRDESNLQKFVLEAKAASALNHPNILTIYEFGETDDAHFIVSEYIEGKTLREIIHESRLKLPEILNISIQIVGALLAAHKAHLIHRDIKPENVMVRPDGYVKILDFGLAKLIQPKQAIIGLDAETAKQNQTAEGIILGTVNYMSPEQAKGERVDERTDIFSFGGVIYEMIGGRTPFAGDSVSETFANLINKEPPPLSRFAANVPDELQRIVAKTIRKNKDERYQTMKGLLTDLKDLQENLAFDEKLERSASPDDNATVIRQATTGDANKQTAETQRNFTERIKQHKSAALAALATFVIALGVIGYLAFFAPRPPITSVAVLPFANESGDANLDYLSDGLSESVIDRLSQLPQLKVIARSSSFKYRGSDIDLQQAANALGAQAIVTGRVARRGDNLMVRVEMIDTRDNKQLWGEQFNRPAMDALAVQREIAQTVSEKLRLKLSGAQETQLARRETVNPQAYELLLKGRFYANKGIVSDWKKAIEYYRQAIAIDPNYALAYAELSSIYQTLANGDLDPKEIIPKAQATAAKALELDENLAEAHLALASLKLNTWQWIAADNAFQRAIELNPNLLRAHIAYSRLLSCTGRHEEAIAEAKRARELDPLVANVNDNLAFLLFIARRYDEAIEVLKKVLELNPNDTWAYDILSSIYSAKGMHAEAVSAYQKAIEVAGEHITSDDIFLGAIYARAGEREKARMLLKRVQASREYVSSKDLAILLTALGERDQALTALEKAYTEHEPQLRSLGVDPAFDPLRDDSRFQDLMQRVGLSQ